MKTKLLSSDDVALVVREVGFDTIMDDAIEGIEVACRDYDSQVYEVPARSGFDYTHPHVGLIEWMPAMRCGGELVIKHVGYHPANPQQHNLPTILSTMLTFDTATGHLTGVVDGTFLTAIRTGAASAVASRVLARPDSRILGLVGAGAQAVSQLHALCRIFPIDTVLVHDLDARTAASFAARVASIGLGSLQVECVASRELATRSDIICTATSVEVGAGPVIEDEHFQAFVHINAVGSDFPGKTELPLSLLKRSLVCPDFPAQAIYEGECQQLESDQMGPDLIELIGNAPQYHQYRDSTTVYDSTGWALQDHIVATIFMRYAQAMDCGRNVQLESVADDPKSPYEFALAKQLRLAAGGSKKT